MRAAGVSSRKVIAPVLLFAAIGRWAGRVRFAAPDAVLHPRKHAHHQRADWRRSSPPISSRAFSTKTFPNTILYVGDVRPGAGHGLASTVFIADVTPPEQRTSGMRRKGRRPADHRGPRSHRRVRPQGQPHPALHARLRRARDGQGQQWPTTLLARLGSGARRRRRRCPSTLASSAMNTRELLRYTGPDWIEPASSCIAVSRCRWPASCWRWWEFRWASPRARAANRPAM